jgi:hypothetical protein
LFKLDRKVSDEHIEFAISIHIRQSDANRPSTPWFVELGVLKGAVSISQEHTHGTRFAGLVAFAWRAEVC